MGLLVNYREKNLDFPDCSAAFPGSNDICRIFFGSDLTEL